jgi:hypothetical protein
MGNQTDRLTAGIRPILDKTLENALAHRIAREFPRIGGPRICQLCAQMILEVGTTMSGRKTPFVTANWSGPRSGRSIGPAGINGSPKWIWSVSCSTSVPPRTFMRRSTVSPIGSVNSTARYACVTKPTNKAGC